MFKFNIAIKPKMLAADNLAKQIEDYFTGKGNIYTDKDPDICFVAGGDGTLLNAIKANKNPKCSFMMINAGTLGFFKEYNVDEVYKFFAEFDYKKLTFEEHHFLKIKDEFGNCALACNEFIWSSPITTLDLNVFINGKYFMMVKGSGICIATPFGSSGYNHSLGGSLLVGDKGLVLSLIAPIRNKTIHPLINSLVIEEGDEITIERKNEVDSYI